MTEDFFRRLPVLLVKGKEDERKHNHDHQHSCRRDAETGLGEKVHGNTGCRSEGKADELPLSQVEHDLRLYAIQVLRNWYKCHWKPPFRE